MTLQASGRAANKPDSAVAGLHSAVAGLLTGPPAAAAPRRSLGLQMALAAILLLGFALRLYRLAEPSLWLDELGQATVALGGLRSAVEGARGHNGAAPLDYLFTWLALQAAHNDFAVRLPAVFAGTLTLAVTYRLGQELFGRTTGVLAALLLAVAPFHLRYSQEARFYALFALMAVASTLAFVWALQRNTLRSWAAYTAVLIVALYSHYYIPLVVLAQALALLAHAAWPNSLPIPHAAEGQPSRPRRLLAWFAASNLVALVAFLPWLLSAELQETGAASAVPPHVTLSLFARTLSALTLNQDVATPEGLSLLAVGLLVALAVAGALGGLWRRETRLGALLPVIILLATLPIVFLVLWWVNYFFSFRQVLYLLPFFLILVAYGVDALARGASRSAAVASGPTRRLVHLGAVGLAAGVLTLCLVPAIQRTFAVEREDWRAALNFVRSNYSAGEGVIAPMVHPPHYLTYYAGDWLGRITGVRTFAELQASAEQQGAAWIISIPPAEAIRSQIDVSEALPIDFGSGVVVYYWKPGHSRQDVLMQAQQWTPPANVFAAADLAAQLQTAGMATAADHTRALASTLAADPAAAFQRFMLQGNAWRKAGQRDLAIAAYKQALSKAPDQAEAWIRLGEQLLLSDRLREAESALKRAQAINPDLYWAHRLLGQAYAAQGRHAAAVDQLTTAVRLQPDLADTYYLLGNELAILNDPQRAAPAYEKYLQLAPDGVYAAPARQQLSTLRANQ